MTGALAVRATPTVNAQDVDLRQHHDAWTGPTAKVRAAEACASYNVPALVSLTWAFLYQRNTNASPHTARAYALGVRRLVAWAEDHGVNLRRPERTSGAEYRADLQAGLPSPGSANTRLTGARALIRALAWVGLQLDDMFQNVPAIRDPRPDHEIRPEYGPTATALMLRAAQDELDRLIVLLAGANGLRASEMLALTWADVDLANGTARVTGKGRRPATVFLSSETLDELRRLPHRSGPILMARSPDEHGHVRPISPSTMRYRAARMAAAAGVIPSHRGRRPRREDGTRVDAGVHRLRHGYATALADRYGVDAAQIGLRHASIQTTQRYVKRRDQRVRAFAQEYRLAT